MFYDFLSFLKDFAYCIKIKFIKISRYVPLQGQGQPCKLYEIFTLAGILNPLGGWVGGGGGDILLYLTPKIITYPTFPFD